MLGTDLPPGTAQLVLGTGILGVLLTLTGLGRYRLHLPMGGNRFLEPPASGVYVASIHLDRSEGDGNAVMILTVRNDNAQRVTGVQALVTVSSDPSGKETSQRTCHIPPVDTMEVRVRVSHTVSDPSNLKVWGHTEYNGRKEKYCYKYVGQPNLVPCEDKTGRNIAVVVGGGQG